MRIISLTAVILVFAAPLAFAQSGKVDRTSILDNFERHLKMDIPVMRDYISYFDWDNTKGKEHIICVAKERALRLERSLQNSTFETILERWKAYREAKKYKLNTSWMEVWSPEGEHVRNYR